MPWPKHTQLPVRALLLRAQGVAEQLRTAGVRLYAPLVGGKKARDLGVTLNLIRTYWQTLWPDLSSVLAGDGDPDELTTSQLHQHAQTILQNATEQILGQDEAFQSGIRLAYHVMKPFI
ncbi:hypothetical protein GCM10008957_33040 [Deinococcus ruber]|uniref:Uncharacterized protein n=1 Tax=Deinococcus ruber TaxID=1848197 RepID=A0A918F997_9DEIO|nr:hypothetical protein GCM10008957_33040 [Deinococcus ruber]